MSKTERSQFSVGDIVIARGFNLHHLIYTVESVDEENWDGTRTPGELIKIRGYRGQTEYIDYESGYDLAWPAGE